MPILQKKSKPIQPTRTIVLSFLMIVLFGTTLLILPISSRNGTFTNPLDALFTATSATCVTGLVIFDTYSHWNYFGQGIILLMIQLGGLGLVTFTSFFNFAIGRKLGLRSMQAASESVSSSGFTDIKALVGNVIKMSVCLEGLGAIILTTVFVPKYGLEGVFISVFLAVSAFCNAGFDILGFESPFISLTNYAENPVVLITIMGLIVCGGLGFVVWNDLYQYRKTKRLVLHTKIVLIATGVLIAFGTVSFLILEWNNPKTLGEFGFLGKFARALFQSVTLRTAGFNTVPIGDLNSYTKMLSTAIMFIGAAPGSTGGGIKVTTFTVLLMTVWSVMRNKPDTVIMGRKIDKDTVYKALAISVLAGTLVIITTCTLVYTNGPSYVTATDSIFEAVSAFATVGLSAGPTAVANSISKILLALTMFIGRVGPVSLALSLTMGTEIRSKNQVIPEGKVIVG